MEDRLRRLLVCNPLRADFQEHFEGIVAAYNREKDPVTIKQTFEALLKLASELDEEDHRAVREGLDEESLAIFDLLKKPDPNPGDIKRINEVAVGLLEKLKADKLRVDQWRAKEATCVTIHDFLYRDETGLPSDDYTGADVETKPEEVFLHVYRAYPTVPSPYYSTSSVA